MPRIQLAHYVAHYQQQGDGPDVVLIHGFTSNLAMWVFSGITAALADRFRVTAYDLRGHGASSAPERGYTSEQLANDLADLHAALRLEAAYLVGHSLGGVVAMQAAVVHPAIVAGVVLSDTYFPGLAHLEPNMPHAEVWRSLQHSVAAAGHEIGPTVDFRRLLDVIVRLTPAEHETLVTQIGVPAARWLSQLRPLAATTAAEEVFLPAGLSADPLASVRQPIVALYDERTPFEATWRWLQANLADCRGERVPGASHLALVENPAAFSEIVRRHLLGLVENPKSKDVTIDPCGFRRS